MTAVKTSALVDEVAQGLAGEKAAAIVEDDVVAPLVEIRAVAGGVRRHQDAGQCPQLVVGGNGSVEDVEFGAGDLARLDRGGEVVEPRRQPAADMMKNAVFFISGTAHGS